MSRRRPATIAATLVLAAGLCNSAWAYQCESYLTGVSTARGDTVYLQTFAGSNWIALCNLMAPANGVPIEQCKVVFAQLLGAHLAGKRVRLWFNDNDGKTCSTQTSWQYATGWYFGPDVID